MVKQFCLTPREDSNNYYHSESERDRTLSGTTTLEPGSNGNKGVLYIPQNSKTGVLPSKGLVSYPGYLLRSYLSAEKQLT